MTLHARTSIRNAGLVAVQRGLIVLCSLLFVVVVPRWMGNTHYGQYSLVTSLMIWFVLFSSLGFTQVIGRFMPGLVQAGDRGALRGFVGNLIGLRLLAGAVSVLVYLLITAVWLGEIDRMFVLAISATVFLQSFSSIFFSITLGENKADRWVTGETLRRWLTLILLLPGVKYAGLTGAGLAFVAAEVVVIGIGIFWVRDLVSWRTVSFSLKALTPQLRFGLVLYLSDLVMSAFSHTGEVLMRLSGSSYMEISYFSVAFNVYYLLSLSFGQLTTSFMPLLSSWMDENRRVQVATWISRLQRVFSAAAMIIVFGALLAGNDLIRILMGSSYQPAGIVFIPLAFALIMYSASNQNSLMLVLQKRPRVIVIGSGIRLAVYWCLGILLSSRLGSLGTGLAILIANSILSGYYFWQTRRILAEAQKGWLKVVLLGVPFLPLYWLGLDFPYNILLLLLVILLYAGLLVGLRVIATQELISLWRALKKEDKKVV